MIDKEWLTQIVGVVSDISDRSYQERTWFGKSRNQISSPDEMYNMLFGDYAFDKFFEQYSSEFTLKQKQQWLSLKNELEKYNPPMRCLDPFSVLDDPQWEQVRIAAGRFVTVFQ